MPRTNERRNLESRKGKYIVLIVWIPQGRCESQGDHVYCDLEARATGEVWGEHGGREAGGSSIWEQPETISSS